MSFKNSDRAVGFATFVFGAVGISLVAARIRKTHRKAIKDCSPHVANEPEVTHSGSCYCQKVQFTVKAPKVLRGLYDKTSKISYPHLHISQDKFELGHGKDALSMIKILSARSVVDVSCFFCSECGVHVWRTFDGPSKSAHVNLDLISDTSVESISLSLYEGWATSPQTNISTSCVAPSPSQVHGAPRVAGPRTATVQQTSTDQNVQSTNILAVQIYGAFAAVEPGRGSATSLKPEPEKLLINSEEENTSNAGIEATSKVEKPLRPKDAATNVRFKGCSNTSFTAPSLEQLRLLNRPNPEGKERSLESEE